MIKWRFDWNAVHECQMQIIERLCKWATIRLDKASGKYILRLNDKKSGVKSSSFEFNSESAAQIAGERWIFIGEVPN